MRVERIFSAALSLPLLISVWAEESLLVSEFAMPESTMQFVERS